MIRVCSITLMSIILVVSCSRDNSAPAPRYDEHQCPFCVMDKGTCTYCKGATKCSFCKGTGTRTIEVKDRLNEKPPKISYKEPCPFCTVKGECRHCEGNGKCWACNGTGRVESWDFFGKAKRADSAARK